jgi:hypothetical protein
MRRLGWGVFSLALGIAVQVSGIEGLLAAELAWTAVVVGVVLVVLSWLRPGGRRRSASRRPGNRESRLDRSLRRLGREILVFLHAREVEAPGWDSSASTLRHPLRASRVSRALRAYEDDTMAMYREKFAPRVRDVVGRMVGDHLGRNEARTLVAARTVLEAEATGRRLIEIGEGITSRKRRAA